MTHINGKQSGTIDSQAPADLVSAIKQHRQSELVSFHTPGHKGYATPAHALVDDLQSPNRVPRGADLETAPWLFDVTELPGLDELADPTGVLASIEAKAARVWNSEHSFLSVNGASAAIIAAICASAPRGRKILIPRNAHRSVIQAMVLSGLFPIWYTPDWDGDWQCWSSANLHEFEKRLNVHAADLACALVVSPTYSGACSDIRALSSLCKSFDVPLIVDEAHGAHLFPGTEMPPSAVTGGADMVVHSLHKTLSALTQTGLLHRLPGCPVDEQSLRASLNLVQSSSPSYLLMASIEQSLAALESPAYVTRIEAANRSLRLWLNKDYIKYSQDPAHVLIRLPGMTAPALYENCCRAGVYPEAIIGNGVLFMFSPHTTTDHIDFLLSTLDGIAQKHQQRQKKDPQVETISEDERSPLPMSEQVLSPRQAFFSKTEMVALERAIGRIAADCLAPCPPGIPILVPGQRISQEVIPLCTGKTKVRVVLEVDSPPTTDTPGGKQNPRRKQRSLDQKQGEN